MNGNKLTNTGVRVNHAIVLRGSPEAVQRVIEAIQSELNDDVTIVFEKTSGSKLLVKEEGVE